MCIVQNLFCQNLYLNYFEENKKTLQYFLLKATDHWQEVLLSKFYYIQNKTIVMENDDRGIKSFPKVGELGSLWLNIAKWTKDQGIEC